MKTPRHLSPTSFALWESDKDRYYQQYLSNGTFEKDPQSLPMAIGSSFDYLVKSFLVKALPKNKLSVSVETDSLVCQIEPHVRDEGMRHGEAVFKAYSKCGALAALMSEIVSDARFEFGVTGRFDQNGVLVESGETLNRADAGGDSKSLLLNGRPDGIFKTCASFGSPRVDVVVDFKVNSWLSNAKSPDPGYIAIYNSNGIVGGAHKDVFVAQFHGVKLSKPIANPWMAQLSVYGWVMGVPVGTPFVGQIHQVIGPSDRSRVALHRFLIPEAFQLSLFQRLSAAWEIINSDWIFRDLSFEQSQAKCKALDVAVACSDSVFDAAMLAPVRER